MHSRHIKILDMLRSGRIEIRTAAKELGVSEMTLRRDLHALEKQKLLIQVKGGALPNVQLGESSLAGDPLLEVKTAIAEKLYERIFPFETLFLGAGSTILSVASVIARRNVHPITVITNALPVASALYRTCCRVILLGGELRTTSPDLVGAAAERNIQEYHVDWLVTGCDGAIPNWGFYTSDMSLSNLEKKSIGIADHTAVVTDSSKFSKQSLTRFASPEEIDLLVTDPGISPEDLEVFKKFPHLEILLTDQKAAGTRIRTNKAETTE